MNWKDLCIQPEMHIDTGYITKGVGIKMPLRSSLYSPVHDQLSIRKTWDWQSASHVQLCC